LVDAGRECPMSKKKKGKKDKKGKKKK